MSPEMRHALDERQALIEQRATTLLDTAVASGEPWTERLGPKPDEPRKQASWLASACTIAAYRDRYQITDEQHPLGPEPQDVTVKQKIDVARTQAALTQTRHLADGQTTAAGNRAFTPRQQGLSI
jgi:hypothetical protein